MKHLFIVLLLLSSITYTHENKEAHAFECNGDKNIDGSINSSYFSREEAEIVRGIRQTNNPLIFEEFNKKSVSFNQERAIKIEWDQAKKIILMGYAKAILQGSYPKPHAYILGGSGSTYVTTPPEDESVYLLASIVDPCHIYIDWALY